MRLISPNKFVFLLVLFLCFSCVVNADYEVKKVEFIWLNSLDHQLLQNRSSREIILEPYYQLFANDWKFHYWLE
jgi:hypothetical protein